MIEIKHAKLQIHEILKNINIIKKDLDYNLKKNRSKEIISILEKLDILKDSKNIFLLRKNLSSLESFIKDVDFINNKARDTMELLELVEEENDKKLFSDIQYELNSLKERLKILKSYYFFSRENDIYNCYIDIQSGSGGIEAQDWSGILLRMYLRWASFRNFKTEIIEETEGEISGIKSATVKIIGNYAYGWFRTETGIHRLVRKSPFDSNNKRHTSFSSTYVYPEVNDDIELNINQSDLKIDFYRASGSGGQHVNRTESAVRITHLPTKIVTQCQNGRSQHKNKDQAMKQLKAKLYEFELRKKEANKKSLENIKLDIRWGNQIRSYILDNSLIKDLRTGVKIRNVQSVLNGDLYKLIEASLRAGL